MRISFDYSIRAGFLIRALNVQTVIDYFIYVILVASCLLLVAGLAMHAVIHRQLPQLLGLPVALAALVWLLKGFYLMHKLVRVDTVWTKNTLKSRLKEQFPHWTFQQLTPQIWRFSNIYHKQQLYVLVTPNAFHLGLLSLGRGYVPSPFSGAANYKQLQQLQQLMRQEQADRVK